MTLSQTPFLFLGCLASPMSSIGRGRGGRHNGRGSLTAARQNRSQVQSTRVSRSWCRLDVFLYFVIAIVTSTAVVFFYYYDHGEGKGVVGQKDGLLRMKNELLHRIQQVSIDNPNKETLHHLRKKEGETSANIPTTSMVTPPSPLPTWLPTQTPTPMPTAQPPTKQPKRNPKDASKKPTYQRKRPPAPTKKRPKRYAGMEVLNVDPEWGYKGEYPWIEVMPTPKKIPLKHDRRVVFRNLTFSQSIGQNPVTLLGKHSSGPRSTILGQSRDLMLARAQLQEHVFHSNPALADGSMALEDVMETLYKACGGPIYLGMATVHDDLYWQLIENFFYTSTRFHFSQCAMMICISDNKCMEMCHDALFPCYNYTYRSEADLFFNQQNQQHTVDGQSVENNHHAVAVVNSLATKKVPVMEQIAQVKLLLVPRALQRGVSLFLLDLDVGFLHDPAHLLQPFLETPIVDIMVQEDYLFIMNRSRAGWKSWFTEPLPNIGLFLVRGNNRTQRVFDIAWEKYREMDDDFQKQQPGKDQNHVLDAMRITRGVSAMKYAYYDNNTAPLLDKLVLKHGNVMELGGELLANFLADKGSIATHATCYEKSTKVHGLRAAAAFWNPRHYDPLQRTLTKHLVYIDEATLLEELRSLVYLAIVTQRKLIIPNLLGDPGPQTMEPGRYPDFGRIAHYHPPSTPPSVMDTTELGGVAPEVARPWPVQRLWPGFRTLFLKRSHGRNELDVDILEPNFYWRIRRDYDVPDPVSVLFFPTAVQPDKDAALQHIKEQLQSPLYTHQTRVVLVADHPNAPVSLDSYQTAPTTDSHGDTSVAVDKLNAQIDGEVTQLVRRFRTHERSIYTAWAEDSVGAFPLEYKDIKAKYVTLPSVKGLRQLRSGISSGERSLVGNILQTMRLCKNVFHPPAGNRTCFQVCD